MTTRASGSSASETEQVCVAKLAPVHLVAKLGMYEANDFKGLLTIVEVEFILGLGF